MLKWGILTWLIIVLVVALFVGPIMYVLPSAKDKRLLQLRMKARQAGLGVRLTHIDRLDPEAHERVSASGVTKRPTIECAAYQLAHDMSALADLPDQVLLRLPPAPTVMFDEILGGWVVLRGQNHDIFLKHVDFLTTWVQQLPVIVLAVGIDGRHISCYWRETSEAESGIIEELREHLEKCRDHFSS